MRDLPATEAPPTMPLVVIGGLLGCCCLVAILLLALGAYPLPFS